MVAFSRRDQSDGGWKPPLRRIHSLADASAKDRHGIGEKNKVAKSDRLYCVLPCTSARVRFQEIVYEVRAGSQMISPC